MEPYALVVGETLVDVFARPDGSVEEIPGGSAANAAVALARLGRPVRFATAYADDDRGRLVADHLGRAGVVPATDPYVLDRTASATATLDSDGSASYVFDLAWRLAPVDLPALSADPPRVVHVCSIGAVLEPGADAVLALLDALSGTAAVVTYDVNARAAITGTGPEVVGRVEAVARRVALVKASDEDLAVLWPTLSPAEAAEHLLGLGPRAVVITRGAAGLAWITPEETLEAPAVASVVVDTIGAGDTVSAAILDALWDGLDPVAVLDHAARAAAVTVSRPGADPPTRAELG